MRQYRRQPLSVHGDGGRRLRRRCSHPAQPYAHKRINGPTLGALCFVTVMIAVSPGFFVATSDMAWLTTHGPA
jgi:hypothetical protein